MDINNWSEKEAERAEITWGDKLPPYTIDAFEFILDGINSWLDLGCGFGRFFDYLEYAANEPDYIGYDSSTAMLDRFKNNHPAYAPRVFLRDITDPINNHQEGIICNAVLIHLKTESQDKIFKNILASNPKKFVFDINSPSEQWFLKGQPEFIKYFKSTESNFIMNWQSHYLITKKVLALFKAYKLTIKFYPIQGNRNKVVYFLERRV